MKDFKIHIVGLSLNKPTEFDYEFGDAFLKQYNAEFGSEGRFNAVVVLDKHETFIEADFRIRGVMKLTCDRSLEEFDEPVEIDKKIVFKYGEENTELSDEIISIARDTATLDLGQYVYEFISLSLPMKRLHPKFRDEETEELDDVEGKMVYTSGSDGPDESDEVDPRWEQLKKLK